MSRFWSPVVHQLDPYVPGEQPRQERLIKLNTNEHPYGPSPRAIEAMRAAADDRLRLYPDPESDALRDALAERLALSADNVFVGNGSDEVLAHVFMALLNHERPLWFPDITYGFYPVYCALHRIAHRAVPLDARLRVAPADYLDHNGQPGAIIFANPNAPTGHALPLDDIERIVTGNPDIVVVVDEAYVDFGADSAATLIRRHPNLLVVQTFSKSRSLAGLRVGFAVGDAALIAGLSRVKNSFNSFPLDRIAQAGALASLQDEAHFIASCQKVMATRERLDTGLAELGFEVLPSRANFVFARHPDHDAALLAKALREQGILVRHFAKPRIAQYLRITVGTDDDTDALLHALGERGFT